jgi:ribosomal protein S27E
MFLRRLLPGAGLLCAVIMLAGCTATAETLDLSGTKLAGSAIQATSTPVPPVAFDFCAGKIAADKAAAIAAANRKALAAKATRTQTARSHSHGPAWRVSCSECGALITVHGSSGTRGRCPRCGAPYVAYRVKILLRPAPPPRRFEPGFPFSP